MTQRDDHLEQIESIIDYKDLSYVMEIIFDICHGKAEHLRSNWQDNNAAKAWEHNANLIDKLTTKLTN